MVEKAEIPAFWKMAKITPLYKKGSVLDPGNYCMLAVNGTLYRTYANVLREVVTGWCQKKIFQTLSLHAAQVKRPNASPRLHSASIDFKQAYDTIHREALWEHLQRICMPTCLLMSISLWMAASKHVCAPTIELSKAARFPPCRFPCASMTWITWQKLCKGLLQALVICESRTC
eukprot:1141400-Pelagomonas_calceolata.AAC.3